MIDRLKLMSIFLFCSVAFLTLRSVTQAQLEVPQLAEIIRSYDVQIDIEQSGEIYVKEQIDYDFGVNEKHGIYRNIPYIKMGIDEETGETVEYKMDIDVISVEDQGGNAYEHSDSDSGRELSIRIGDPDRTISGQHTYVIEYKVSGALEYFADHDELYWDAIGTDWDVTIHKARTNVRLNPAKSGTAIQTRCFLGIEGSDGETDCTIEGTTFTSNRHMLPSEGMTVVIGFPKGLVAELLPERIVPFFETLLGKIVMLLIFIACLLWYVIYPIWIFIKWLRMGRDPDLGPTVTAFFEAPETKSGRKLKPGEAGALHDETVNLHDVTATLIDLARRGYMKIDEREKNEIYLVKGAKDFKKDDTLLNFELKLLQDIFDDSKTEVKVKDLKLYTTVQEASDMLYNGLVDAGFFPDNPNKTRNFYNVMAGLALTTFNIPLLLSAAIFGRLMPRKTLVGAQESQKAKALKNFLISQSSRLEFEAKEYFHLKNVQTLFEKLLPFAVAFGVEKVWMKRFEGMNLAQPDWYNTYRSSHFSSAVFADSLNSSFKSISSSATPPRSSTGGSSGFSSGGFSGGGGGGGGGGSW